MNDQMNLIENLETYSKLWQEKFNKKDLNGMEDNYRKINSAMKKIVPIENILNNCNKIINIHNLIKNNGNNFQISDIEKKLAEIL